MPVIRLSCLPQTSEEELQKLHQCIVAAVLRVSELGLKSQDDMTVLFSPDMMQYGLGEEIIVEVFGLLYKSERTIIVRQNLAKAIGFAVRGFLPSAKVEVFIQSFDPNAGFWASDQKHGDGFRFAVSALVRTTEEDASTVREFRPEALPGRKWGIWGTVVKVHDSHGLCYIVRHDDDGTEAPYNPSELE